MTQKEAFLKYLELMDFEMLDLIMDDSITYFGATKKVFLEKLKFITSYLDLPEAANSIKVWQHKKHQNIYYIYLKYISRTSKFFIEEEDNKIKKIYTNHRIKNRNDAIRLTSFDLFFMEDEMADFIATDKYLNLSNKCKDAYEELVNDEIHILTSKDISNYLIRHENLFRSVWDQYKISSYRYFTNFYFMLNNDFKKLRHFKEANIALKTFSNSTLPELHDWLVEYYSLAWTKVNSFNISFSKIDFDEKTIQWLFYSNIYFTGEDFFTIIKFDKLYFEQYMLYNNSVS